MADKKRAGLLLVLVALGAAAAGLKYNEARQERARLEQEARKRATPPPKPVREWRWPQQPEWVAHQVLRHISSWTVSEEGRTPTLAVKRSAGAPGPGRIEGQLTGGPNPLSFSIEPGAHIWDPAAYVGVATQVLSGALSEAGEPVPEVGRLLLVSDIPSLLEADTLLLADLSARPRDPRLHEQAALLWAAHAMRESARGRTDPTPFLNGVVAHLAVSRALGPSRVPSPDAEIAAIVLDVLLLRQTEALKRLETLNAGSPDIVTAAWANALRIRITHDPRFKGPKPFASRLEKLEYLIALGKSRQDCNIVIPTAKAWGIPPAADWGREALPCFDEEYITGVGDPFLLQAKDAASMAGVSGDTPEEVAAALNALSRTDTHQPERPRAIVPATLRAEAGLRHLAEAYEFVLSGIMRRAIDPSGFTAQTAGLRALLPQDPFLELAPNRRDPGTVALRPDICDRIGKLITDRPDFLANEDWRLVNACIGHPATRGVVRNEWQDVAIAGTGLVAAGPWHAGPAFGTPEYEEAVARAPWNLWQAYASANRRGKGVASVADLLAVYSGVLDYDANAIQVVLREETLPSDEFLRLAERACALEADSCATSARRLMVLGHIDAGLALGRRALEKSRDQITLSNNMSLYVSMLQERGRLAEAMKVARRMGAVYSEAGLQTLAKAHERLGDFKEAARVYGQITERYGENDTEDEFYIRHAQRHGAAPFEARTEEALKRRFPNGLRKTTLEEAAQAKNPLSLNDRTLYTNRLRNLGLALRDSFVAVDGFVVETAEQFGIVADFTDDPNVVYLVKREDGRIEEVRTTMYRAHYDIVGRTAGR